MDSCIMRWKTAWRCRNALQVCGSVHIIDTLYIITEAPERFMGRRRGISHRYRYKDQAA